MDQKVPDPVPPPSKRGSSTSIVPGLAVFGCMVTGLVALFSALTAVSRMDFVGSGICFLAAVAGFGIVVYASFKD